jgi:ABC-type uncharacterized transport system involved in gliding motility auxiliary subunit
MNKYQIVPWVGVLLLIGGLVYSLLAGDVGGLAALLMLAGSALLLGAALLQPQAVRQLLAGRTARYGVANGLLVGLFTAVFLLLYWLAYQNPHWRLDTTAGQEFSANPEIIALLAEAETPIQVLGFFSPRAAARQESARTYLETLTGSTDQLRYEFIDWEANPVLAEQYGIEVDGTLVFILPDAEAEGGERTAVLYALNDRELFTTLRQLIFPRTVNAYVITGHGEPSISDSTGQGLSGAASLAQDVGIYLQPLDLRLAGQIPPDADVILLLHPRRALDAAEMSLLAEFSAQGGGVLVVRDVLSSTAELAAELGADPLTTWLTAVWGVTFQPDLVVDPDRALYQRPFAFVVDRFGNHPIITAEVRQFTLLLDVARSLQQTDTAVDGILTTGLAFTSDTSWGETDLQNPPPNQDDQDNPAPLTLAAAFSQSQTEARLVTVGDLNLFLNEGIYLNGNSVFWLNTLNWLAGDEHEQSLDFVPREAIARQLTISPAQVAFVQFVALFVLPALILLAGLAVWQQRRGR